MSVDPYMERVQRRVLDDAGHPDVPAEAFGPFRDFDFGDDEWTTVTDARPVYEPRHLASSPRPSLWQPRMGADRRHDRAADPARPPAGAPMSRGEWAFGLLMSLVLVIEAAVYAPWWLAAAVACLAGWWGCQAACLHLAAQIAELKLELTDIERAP